MLPNPIESNESTNPDFNPIKRDFNDYDSLIAELNTPKEQITSSPNQVPAGQGPVPGLSVAENGIDQPIIEISAEAAAMTGGVIAGTVDTVLALGASIYAKADDQDPYKAKHDELQQLKIAWAAVAKKLNYSIEDSPYLNLLILNTAVYLPVMLRAKSDRESAILRQEMADMQRKQELRNLELKAEIDALRDKDKPAA